MKGAMPVPVASIHKSPPSSRFASVNVPVGFSPTCRVSPSSTFSSLLVKGPFGTLIL